MAAEKNLEKLSRVRERGNRVSDSALSRILSGTKSSSYVSDKQTLGPIVPPRRKIAPFPTKG